MFLSVLSKDEKLNFSQLLELVAKIDGTLSRQENEQISVYLNEMGLTEVDIPKNEVSIDELINKLSEASETVKKAIFIELLAFVYVDGEFCEKEKACIDKIQSIFGLSVEYKKEVISWVNVINPLYIKGFELAGII